MRRTLAKGAAVVACLGLLGWLATTFYNGVPGRDYRTVYAEVPQTGNLLLHDPVRIAGVRVGQVRGIATASNGWARVRLQLDPGVSLARDTRVVIRAAGLLGARYVELRPGKAPEALADGATIRGSHSSFTFGLPEALDTFDPRTRRALAEMIDGLGQGTLGQGDRLNEAIRASAPAMQPFQKLAREVLARPGAAERLLPSLDRAVTPLAAARQDIGAMLEPASRAVAPFSDRRESLWRTLEEAPPALSAATSGLERGRRLVGAARDLAVAAQGALAPAPAGLRSASALLRESRTPLARTASLLAAARPAIPSVLRLTDRLDPVLDPLGRALGRLEPILTQVGDHGCDLRLFGVNMRSMTGLGGAVGQGPAGPPGGFRLQVVPWTEVVGSSAQLKVKRAGYSPPCSWPPSRYPAVNVKDLLGGGR